MAVVSTFKIQNTTEMDGTLVARKERVRRSGTLRLGRCELFDEESVVGGNEESLRTGDEDVVSV